MSKKALGRGLEALFQATSDTANVITTKEESINFDSSEKNKTTDRLFDSADTVAEQQGNSFGYYIDITKIKANPDQPRKEFNQKQLEDLSESIREKGILQPILVEKNGDNFVIIAGERRFRAAGLAGLTQVPIIEKNFTDREKYEIALIENIQRENLSPIEEAKAYQTLINNYNLGQEELSKIIGKNRSTIANSIRLLKMPNEMQDALNAGDISSGHARAILSVINPSDQIVLFKRITERGLSVRDAERQAVELNNGQKALGNSNKVKSPVKQKDPSIADIEQKFIDKFGTKVNLNGTLAKGKIEISYFSKDDLERIFDLLL